MSAPTMLTDSRSVVLEITSQKINAVLQGNNISGGNVGNTGVFQNTTIEGGVHF